MQLMRRIIKTLGPNRAVVIEKLPKSDQGARIHYLAGHLCRIGWIGDDYSCMKIHILVDDITPKLLIRCNTLNDDFAGVVRRGIMYHEDKLMSNECNTINYYDAE